MTTITIAPRFDSDSNCKTCIPKHSTTTALPSRTLFPPLYRNTCFIHSANLLVSSSIGRKKAFEWAFLSFRHLVSALLVSHNFPYTPVCLFQFYLSSPGFSSLFKSKGTIFLNKNWLALPEMPTTVTSSSVRSGGLLPPLKRFVKTKGYLGQ